MLDYLISYWPKQVYDCTQKHSEGTFKGDDKYVRNVVILALSVSKFAFLQKEIYVTSVLDSKMLQLLF